MITTKTLPLVLKAATATMPASVVGQRPTIAMVTAINSQKAVLSTDVQNTPVNLQTSSKVTGPGAEAVQIVAKNTVTLVSQQLLLMCAHMRGFRICICRVYPFYAPAGFFSRRHSAIPSFPLGLTREYGIRTICSNNCRGVPWHQGPKSIQCIICSQSVTWLGEECPLQRHAHCFM